MVGQGGSISFFNLAVANPQSTVTIVTGATVGQGDLNVVDYNFDSSLLLTCGMTGNIFKVWNTNPWGINKTVSVGGALYGC